jgi:hypothetical protein
MEYLMTIRGRFPLYREIITPQVTPLGAMSAVVDGAADVAPIDSYAFALLQKYRRDLTLQLRSVARTAPTPIPLLVASRPGFEALTAVLLEGHRIATIAPMMSDLLLERFVRPDPATYDALRLNFEAAIRYWHDHPLAAIIHPAFG